ncbi:hypothetical protein PVAG01_04332 [Phlyctema vagabunda]|uniref:2EXR domain-containing protein n=1 Tax=Phlyctema vagabunda TaxID=108571 RepID=A0ABR4PP28_9HELO
MPLTCDKQALNMGYDQDISFPIQQQFTVFHRLPKELRLLIWFHALVPRVISLHRRDITSGNGTLAFLSQAPTDPIVIWVALACVESCRVVQSQYLEWQLSDFFRDISNSMICPLHDVVYFPYEYHAPTLLSLTLKFPKQMQRLRALALPSESCNDSDDALQVLEILHDMENLKELIIVKKDGVKPWGESERVWVLPGDIKKSLAGLKKNKWPEWKLPVIKMVSTENEILTC